MNLKTNSPNPRSRSAIAPATAPAFTLVELVAVAAVVVMLSALLVPTMAGGKADNWRAQCQSQMKQLGTGINLFAVDRNDTYPAAGCSDADSGQLAWDCYIHRYIGGKASDELLVAGVLDRDLCPNSLRCPTDTLPDISWNPGIFGRRSYAMVSVGPNWSSQFLVKKSAGQYVLPPLSRGVGIYWSAPADWLAPGYRTSVAKDPSTTLLLVEEPNASNLAGNIWPCISVAPTGTGALGTLCQIDAGSSPASAHYGLHTYRLHGHRFNYLFHDGHVEPFTIEQTVGLGTTNAPKGMWTVAAGD